MRWRGFILIAVLVGLGAWLFSSRKPDRPPNVLLVTIDTLRTDRIGCYGYKAGETPASDRLAREGIVFERAFTPVPVTRPAHASILTGLSPRRHGVRDNLNSQLGGNEVTLPELLEDVGYQTFAVVSASPLVAASGLNQGFSRYLDQLGGSLQTGTVQTHLIERPAGETTRHAIRLLEQRDPDRPFFLWIHYFDPHAEYRAPEPFFTRFSGRRYDGEVAYCESELEKVLGYLSRSGEDDRTLVIYTSDHGEGLGEHGEDAHGHFLFDSTLRVPLIIRLPGGARSGTRFREPVSLLDLFSTVQSVAGIPNTRPGDGVDLASLWNGEGIKDRVLYAESFYSLGHFGWSPLVSVRAGEYKWIRSLRKKRKALYRVEKDPGEVGNLMARVGSDPECGRVLNRLETALGQMLRMSPQIPDFDRSSSMDRRALVALQYTGLPMPRAESAAEAPDDPSRFIRDYHRAMALAHSGSRPGNRKRDFLTAARRVLRGLVGQDPENPSLWMLLGQLAKVEGQYDIAAKNFRKAWGFRPGSRLLSEAVADALCLGERYGEALDYCRQVLENDTGHAGLWKIRSFGALRQGDFHETVRSARRCLKIGGELYPSVRCYLAAGLLGMGDLRAAVEALEKVTESRLAPMVQELREQAFQQAVAWLRAGKSPGISQERRLSARWLLKHHFSARQGVNELLQREGVRD